MWGHVESIDYKLGAFFAACSLSSLKRSRAMKKFALSLIGVAALGAMGTAPAYASGGGGGGFLCNLPIIGKLLCPPTPGGGGGGGTSVPEPATLAVLGAGAAAAIAARRRRSKK